MTTDFPTATRADAESLAAKLTDFYGSLPAPEQVLLWKVLNGATADEVQGYTAVEYGVMLALIIVVCIASPATTPTTNPLGPSVHPFAGPAHPFGRI
jgi:hypothetical protein